LVNNFHINASEKVNIRDSVQRIHFHYGRERRRKRRDEERGWHQIECVFSGLPTIPCQPESEGLP
jgi:hypothetical protein